MLKRLSIVAITVALLLPGSAMAEGILVGRVDLVASDVIRTDGGINFTLSGTMAPIFGIPLDLETVDPACLENLEAVVHRLGPRRTGPRGIVATAPVSGTTFSIPVGPVSSGLFSVSVRSQFSLGTDGSVTGSGWDSGWGSTGDPWNSGWDSVGDPWGWGSGSTGSTDTSNWVWDAETGGWVDPDAAQATQSAPCTVAMGGVLRVRAPAAP